MGVRASVWAWFKIEGQRKYFLFLSSDVTNISEWNVATPLLLPCDYLCSVTNGTILPRLCARGCCLLARDEKRFVPKRHREEQQSTHSIVSENSQRRSRQAYYFYGPCCVLYRKTRKSQFFFCTAGMKNMADQVSASASEYVWAPLRAPHQREGHLAYFPHKPRMIPPLTSTVNCAQTVRCEKHTARDSSNF